MGPGVPLVPIGVEAWMGEPNDMLKGSRSWVGWGCSVEIGTSAVVGQKGEKESQDRTKDRPGGGKGAVVPLPEPVTSGGGGPCSSRGTGSGGASSERL